MSEKQNVTREGLVFGDVEVVKSDGFRSKPSVECEEDMTRVVLDMPKRTWRRLMGILQSKRTIPPIETFEQWLTESQPSKTMTLAQRNIAEQLLSLPLRSGKSWLIERLYKFDNRHNRQLIVFR